MIAKPPMSVAEREEKLKQGLADEETRKNVNDSKFRAVAQRMDYSGFHQMVLGANLKPTKSGEVFTISQTRSAIFNSSFSAKPSSSLKKPESESILISWRRASKAQRRELLEKIEDFQHELIKFNEIGVAVEIIEALFECENNELIRRGIDMLKGIKEFKGCKKLMSRREKEKLDEVIIRAGDENDTVFFESG